jgi:glycine cleavage system transcriptional repressor
MGHVAVSALGADRPGIVAAVTQVLYETGANLEDTSMSILRGHFSMMLVVAVPDGTRAADLEAALAAVADRLDLVLAVRDIDDEVPESPEGEAWTAVVYGADQPGIVHRITHTLAGLRANITDLTTRVIGDEDQPTYAMVVDLTLPPGADGAAVERRLQELGSDLEVDISLHPSEADIL